MVSKAKEIDGFDKNTIYQDLRKENRNDLRLIYIILDLIFSPGVMDIVKELEEDFKDNGNRHYPRLLLLGIVLYCFKQKDYKYTDIVMACKSNLFLRIFTRGVEPCESTFRNFLNTPKPDSFRKIFLYTLLRFNEYDLLKFLHYFVDGTDAIIRGSKFYKIYQIELEAMKFMAEHNLLHNSKEKQMKRSINKLIARNLRFFQNFFYQPIYNTVIFLCRFFIINLFFKNNNSYLKLSLLDLIILIFSKS